MINTYANNLPAWDPNRKELETIVTTINKYVEESAELAYDVGVMNCECAKQKQWVDSVTLLFEGKEVPFIYARYGYAVEELSNIKIKLEYGNGSNGFTVNLQETHGHTRPDIVIRYGSERKEVAWLDITSEGSKGHIFNKLGSGWVNRPYVAEITYPYLDTKKIIFKDDKDGAKRNYLLKMINDNLQREKLLKEYLILKFDDILRIFDSKPYSQQTAAELAKITEDSFGITFKSNYKHPVIKSMLQTYVRPPSGKYAYVANIILSGIYKREGQSQSLMSEYISESYHKANLK